MNGPPGPAVTNVTAAVQRDWENRELVEALRLQVKALATFVSDFDSVSRGKLAALNDRLTRSVSEHSSCSRRGGRERAHAHSPPAARPAGWSAPSSGPRPCSSR